MDQSTSKPLKVKMKYKKTTVTRENVYKAAIEVMEEKGYKGATIRDICQRANVSPATFYSYYRSKIDILSDIYLPGDSYFNTVVMKEIADKDCFEQLRIFTSSYAKLNINTSLEVMRFLFNPENEWFAKIRPMQYVMLDIVKNGQTKGLLTSDYSALRLVEDIFSLLRGVCYTWCIYNGSFDLEERMLEQINLFIRGIATTSPNCFNCQNSNALSDTTA